VTIEAGGDSFVLEVGDAVAFSGDVPHSYANPGAEPSRFTLAVFEPGVGPATRSELPDA
jgi:quercetin dioxygenase-like cupin family protein